MQNYLARQEAKEFPSQNFQGMAQEYFDPNWRYQQLQQNPAYKASESFLAKQYQRQMASQGIHGQVNGNGQFSNNFAVPMADVLAKNANQWDTQLFSNIRDASGMTQGRSSQQTAGAFLPSIYNNQNNAYGELLTQLSNHGPNMLDRIDYKLG